MTDEVKVDASIGVVEVVSSGVLTLQDMQKTRELLQTIHAEKAIQRVLIDTTRLESAPSLTGVFEIWSTFPRGFKIALLVSASSPVVDEVAFAETVGRNRFQNVKVFTDEREARQWLGLSS